MHDTITGPVFQEMLIFGAASIARAETYHAEDNTVTLTLYTENGTKETTLPLTTDILGEWFTNV